MGAGVITFHGIHVRDFRESRKMFLKESHLFLCCPIIGYKCFLFQGMHVCTYTYKLKYLKRLTKYKYFKAF